MPDPQGPEELSVATLHLMRNAAIGHGETAVADGLQREIDRLEKSVRPSDESKRLNRRR